MPRLSDEYVVRVHELSGKSPQQARITFAADIVGAVEADSGKPSVLPPSRAVSTGGYQAFSVKTYKVTLKKNPTTDTRHYMPLSLPYNLKCATFNASFRSEANFEGGYSYAAELFPRDGLTVDGVPFTFGESSVLQRTGL